LLEPNSLAIGNKIKTKLKFGINYIGKKKNKDRNGEYYDRLMLAMMMMISANLPEMA